MKTRQYAPTHVFQSDGVRVHPLYPDTGCTRCPRPKRHPVHRVPDMHAAQAAVRARFGDVDE